jgi:hypothetical protein
MSFARGITRASARIGRSQMASLRTPMESNGDWAEHVKTYKAFLLLLKIAAASTAVVLLALYFFIAR